MAKSQLTFEQLHVLETLVRVPSWYQREERAGRKPNDEREIIAVISELLRDCDCKLSYVTIPGDIRRTLIAEKGSGTEFTLLLYAHVDTVVPDINWANPYDLARDGDKLNGLGVYDMKAGVMTLIHLLRTLKLPKGMKLVVVFGPDEEEDSLGALSLFPSDRSPGWQGIRDVDLVLSPEIDTIKKRVGKDFPRKDVISARRGHTKTQLTVDVPRAHLFNDEAPDAGDVLIDMINTMRSEFETSGMGSRKHPHFGTLTERLKRGKIDVPEEGFSNTSHGETRWRHLTLPGESIVQSVQWQTECLERLSRERGWAAKQVQYALSLRGDATSYEPYSTDMTLPISKAVVDSVATVYGGCKLKAGASTSDANVFHSGFTKLAKNVPVLEVAAIGEHPHTKQEYVSQESIVRNIEWYRTFITQHLPDFLASRGQTS